MKIRNDFVSNSSSSSFIVAIDKDYAIEKFASDIAEKTVNNSLKYHDDKLRRSNQVKLEFCLNNFELMFLGVWTVKTTEKTFTKEEFEKEYEDVFPGCWNGHLKVLESIKNGTVDAWTTKQYGRDYLDKDGKLHMFTDIEQSQFVVEHGVMQSTLDRYSFHTDEEQEKEENVKYRVENMRSMAENNRNSGLAPVSMPEIYQITMNTVNNTRDLIKSGEKVELDEWEDIDRIEKLLKDGKKIVAIRNNYSGDGYDTFAIYSEEGTDGIHNFKSLSFEQIGCID